MKRKHVLTLGSGIAALGVAAFILFEVSGHERIDADPRSAPALVRLVVTQAVGLLLYRHGRGKNPEQSRVSSLPFQCPSAAHKPYFMKDHFSGGGRPLV
ncbi:hypothetical protein J3U99_19625 [Brucella pituitosa]|uniref:hypothetical protein n=1 Tax=Brucella pituitosa TaxID=571256 RepID=UPI00200300FA|nr:hypothetical protein [Brucella pituitosa]MCK4206986.1 hypothetical protein [Brucella pituitosa]